MKLIIDATNIKAGGGLTHLKRLVESYLLNDIEIELLGGEWLHVISSSKTIEKTILTKVFKTTISQEYFKLFILKKYIEVADFAFIPGGTFSSKTVPYISMSQNMLVFEENERNRFPISLTRLRYLILERKQVSSFKNAAGIIFISEYAKKYITNKYPILSSKKSQVIYHGISDDFRQSPRTQKPIEFYSFEEPFKILYVSIINYYKHQWTVVEAVKNLRYKGIPIQLDLVGPINKSLKKTMSKVLIGTEAYVKLKGKIPYQEIAEYYKNSDVFIFASTCENMPNILVEAMSAGLPIVCSNFGPMPEILKDAGLYMNPTNVDSVIKNLEKVIMDPSLRQKLAEKAYEYSLEYSWEKTANETFNFIKETALQTKYNETNHTIL